MCHSLLSTLILFILIVFWAQKVEVLSQVTGYVGLNVTLPCSFIQGKESSNVTQSQRDFLSPDRNKTCIIVFNKQHGKSVYESHLKGRVDMDDQSLQIKNVELSDAGSYICTINTFPLGSFHDTTELHVQGECKINL
uniref:Immunoglobulin domain-containing protein n=1 Tax=Oryzias sinensis TaxID=183150 RepID=A0A8C7WS42_9TELE